MTIRYVDRKGRPLEAGQRLRVRECTGPYGQCSTRVGILRELSQYGGGTIELTEPAVIYRHLRREPKNAGDLVYVLIEPAGYRKFDDFEHGHEVWTEILDAEGAP